MSLIGLLYSPVMCVTRSFWRKTHLYCATGCSYAFHILDIVIRSDDADLVWKVTSHSAAEHKVVIQAVKRDYNSILASLATLMALLYVYAVMALVLFNEK